MWPNTVTFMVQTQRTHMPFCPPKSRRAVQEGMERLKEVEGFHISPNFGLTAPDDTAVL